VVVRGKRLSLAHYPEVLFSRHMSAVGASDNEHGRVLVNLGSIIWLVIYDGGLMQVWSEIVVLCM
jgi:hypothetical protein